LEDNINENLLAQMDSTIEKLPTYESFNQSVINNFEGYLETRLKSFEEQLNKLQTID
jgi:hypothetical protein